MSEKVYKHHKAEQERSSQELEDHSKEMLDKLVEKGKESAAEHAEKVKETLEDIRAETKKVATAADETIAQREEAVKEPEATLLVNKDLKEIKYKRTLQTVRKDLSAPERTLSKVVHNPVVDAVSEAAGKTVARPSGFLMGSIFAFVGSSAFLWISKHYGYKYNFLLFAMFFVAGFVLGILVELGLHLANRKSAKS